MVLAECINFKHGLYKSCGIECFEGTMPEPCLLQPCFHVAGVQKRIVGTFRGPPVRAPLMISSYVVILPYLNKHLAQEG